MIANPRGDATNLSAKLRLSAIAGEFLAVALPFSPVRGGFYTRPVHVEKGSEWLTLQADQRRRLPLVKRLRIWWHGY